MPDHERTTGRRRLRDLAEQREAQARACLAESERVCERLRHELAALVAELGRLQHVREGHGTAGAARHGERYARELSGQKRQLEQALQVETGRLAERRRELVASAQLAAGLQRLVDTADRESARREARSSQERTDEQSTWLRTRGG